MGNDSFRVTLSDRIAIEAGIYRHETLSKIAYSIHKSLSTISREIKANRTLVKGTHFLGKDCSYAENCERRNLCKDCSSNKVCVRCFKEDCQQLCSRYYNRGCAQLEKPPYVCNICGSRRKCKKDRAYYVANQADAMAKRRYSESRSKIHANEEQLSKIDHIVAAGLNKGQPLTHIYYDHYDELGVSERTLYNYIEGNVLSVSNMALRRQVGYRPRKKKKEESEAFLNQQFRKSRTYNDYLEYMEKHPGTATVEMDTVKGVREKGKRLLTLLFCDSSIMLMFLMVDGKADTVVSQFDWLTNSLGLEVFRELFPVILTDNGSEFKHTQELEFTADGKRRTHIFYCDPQASWQKPHIEKNHEYIRYVIPRGKSLNPYTQDDITNLMNNINSTKRRTLGGKAPYDSERTNAMELLMKILNMNPVPSSEVNLSPILLKK